MSLSESQYLPEMVVGEISYLYVFKKKFVLSGEK